MEVEVAERWNYWKVIPSFGDWLQKWWPGPPDDAGIYWFPPLPAPSEGWGYGQIYAMYVVAKMLEIERNGGPKPPDTVPLSPCLTLSSNRDPGIPTPADL